MSLSNDAVQRMLRRWIAIATACAAACAAAPPAAAQSPGDRQNDRPSRRYYTEPVAAEPVVEAGAVALAYRDALAQLAAGDPEAAAAAVAALDPPTGPAAAEALHATRQGIATVLHGIAVEDYRALEPVILLHVGVFRRHRQARNAWSADHHLAVIRFTVAEYAQNAGTPEARATAARVLAAVGLALLDDQRRTQANEHLARALQFDPTNADALLGLAVDRERAGDYANAVDHLEKLVSLRPESAEGRLRLAVNVQRVGRRRNADELFRSLIADREAGWAAAIAYQELANNRIAAGDAAAAAALLREASARFPGSERLRLQLAYAIDRTGDPVAARKAVAELAESPPNGAEDSARRRYNRCPDPAPALELETLRESAAERPGALAAALGSLRLPEAG